METRKSAGMSSGESQAAFAEARELFAEFLKLRELGDAAGIETLCAQHPAFEGPLRELWSNWRRIGHAFRRMRGDAALPEDRERGAPDPGKPPPGAGDIPLVSRLTARCEDTARYQVQGEIARGGMGVVYKVWDEELRRSLAMKVILARGGGDHSDEKPPPDRRLVERFLEEAQVSSQLQHPGIVPVHELGVDAEGRVYFTMPLIKGRDLKEIFALVFGGKDGWTLTRALGVIVKVCEAMAFAHSRGVIHRDLKPANIMVGRFGETYVMDWGLARVLGRVDTHDIRLRPHADETAHPVETDRQSARCHDPNSPLITIDGDVIGTPAYMSPEQAAGFIEQLDRRSDVYSVGAILYHLLAGHMPYAPSDAKVSPHTVLGMVLQGPPPPLRQVDGTLPAELVAICEKAMARDRDHRYGDMLEMARDLEAFLSNRPITAVVPRLRYVVKLAIQRNRPVAATAAAALLLVLALGAFFVLNLQGEVRRTTVERDRNGRLVDALSAAALIGQADQLYPLVPVMVPALEGWLSQVDPLLAKASLYERAAREPASTAPTIESAKLVELLDHLRALAALRPVVAEHLETARTLRARTLEAEEDAWLEAKDDIAHLPAYRDLDLVPQLGLVPLQRNPHSGLWEFWHVLSGARPEIDAETGEPRLDERSGMVLVLIPGGSFLMGSPGDELGRQRNERGHKVTLAPFFISKYEVTQAQWQRVMADNPSGTRAGTKTLDNQSVTPLHPVETVTWFECDRFLHRIDLRFPTEAQWERACRAGTMTAYCWGKEQSSLRDNDNVLTAPDVKGLYGLPTTAEWSDGYFYSAPVGSFRPNQFGLFDMLGNVSEWCADFDQAEYPPDSDAAGDGLMRDQSSDRHAFRGGNWYLPPIFCRAALRQFDFPRSTNFTRGLRCARAMEASDAVSATMSSR